MDAELLLSNPIIEPKTIDEVPQPLLDVPMRLNIMNSSEEDDDCLICYQTLYRPARTECGHSACESCMLHWALTAMETSITSNASPEIPSNLAIAVDGIKFKCPACRTYTQASFDSERSEKLAKRYPEDYVSRESENSANSPQAAEDGSDTMVLLIGNSHRKVEPTVSPYTGKIREHEWTFFVKSSQQDIIEKVEVILHPTYREDRLVILQDPPFSTTHLGWGYFTIFAGIVLKEGWEWSGEDMIVDSDVEKGRVRDRLPVRWMLDFRGGGSMNNKMVKVKKVRDVPMAELEHSSHAKSAEGSFSEDEDEADLSALASFMSESEIAQLREVRRMKRKALKEKNALKSSSRSSV